MMKDAITKLEEAYNAVIFTLKTEAITVEDKYKIAKSISDAFGFIEEAIESLEEAEEILEEIALARKET